MRNKIEQLVKKLRANSEAAVAHSNNISRDMDYRRQDEMNAKLQNALANDLQKILDETAEEEEWPEVVIDGSLTESGIEVGQVEEDPEPLSKKQRIEMAIRVAEEQQQTLKEMFEELNNEN